MAKIFTGEQILKAVNVLATYDETEMDMQGARHIVANSVAYEAETDTDVDGFGDWISQGSWHECETVEQAYKEIDEAAREWDMLTHDFEN